jgi:thiamine-monophosphate kinase
VWVTGPLGAASAGLRALRAGTPAGAALVAAHARPVPRVAEGTAAREVGATAMIDVSDGFGADLGHILTSSGVGAELTSLPVAPGASEADAYGGGDDYELVFCAPAGTPIVEGFTARGLRAPVRVGVIVADPSRRPPAAGWVHDV